jgi:uncharacterized membrane protein YoaT (DUF817 family)
MVEILAIAFHVQKFTQHYLTFEILKSLSSPAVYLYKYTYVANASQTTPETKRARCLLGFNGSTLLAPVHWESALLLH